MRFGSWLAFTGISALLGACSGVTELGNGPGTGGGGGTPSAGMAGQAASQGGEAGVQEAQPAGPGGSAPMSAGGSVGVAGGLLVAVDAQQQSDKLDVLFVVDNSPGAADKQQILAKSLAPFIARLVNPPCVDAKGKPVVSQPATGAEACSAGTRQFAPVKDMHLAAISTSLGSHGGDVCATSASAPELDDQGELLAAKRDAVPSYKNSGFLSFDTAGKTGLPDATAITEQLGTMITAAGQRGCGYEATLESMYRFLIDPAPPLSVVKSPTTSSSTPQGINQELLAQRAAFLRPDSSLAIVILSDENDCSIMDTGYGWFVGAAVRMPRATEVCATNPNDPCCRSCSTHESEPPAGCAPIANDAVCSIVKPGKAYAEYNIQDDSLNLRCFAQQTRFGFDLLNPLDRYSAGLTNPKVYDWHEKLVDNPLFAARGGKGPRSNSLISISVIVGANWQDLATDVSRTSANLSYSSADKLESQQRWPLLVGDPSQNTKPTDPLMIESIGERSGTSPLTNTPVAPSSSLNPLENPINGHEQSVPDFATLQYACTFALPEPVKCDSADVTCECSANKDGDDSGIVAYNSPACQPPKGGPASTTQYFGRAYPGTRQLLLARALGNRATPASICPKDAKTQSSANYGYVPALNALVDRIAVTLK